MQDAEARGSVRIWTEGYEEKGCDGEEESERRG
jgi:hypothetical protein